MRYTILLLVTFLGGCTTPVTVIVTDYERFDPPDIYRKWYREITECVGGQPLPFEQIRWFKTTALHTDIKADHFRSVSGIWIKPDDIILDAVMLDSEWTVKHEVLHYLLQKGEHPAIFDQCITRGV